MFVFSKQHPWEGDPAVQQILVFSCDKAKEDFEQKMEARFLKETQSYAGTDPTYLARYKSGMSDTGYGAMYKLRSVKNSEGTFGGVIRCGVTGYMLWEGYDRFTRVEEALWAAFGEMKKSILRARSQPLYDAVKKRYSIRGFLNQIKTKEELKDFAFCNTERHNVVTIDFIEKHEALTLYHLMHSLNIAAYKNWLD